MDLCNENSGDSVELDPVQLLNMQPMGMHGSAEITITDASILNGTITIDNHEVHQPRVTIVEQPQQRGFRFRYECEGPSHGGLQGVNTERGRKTHPSVRIENYDGPAQIEVSLVTDEDPPRIHAHKLVGKNCSGGICKVDVASTASQISFPNLCILHVTRKKAAEVLMNRILEDVKLQKQMRSGDALPQTTTAEETQNAKKQAQEQARNMQLNVVKLQFRVFLPNQDGKYHVMLPPVVSQPIFDSKSPGASALKICRMDKYGGCCTGNEEVFLLCEKVQKEDISVRFVEHNVDGSVKWEAYGNFSPLDVHRQYAIVFKTPAYYNANIDKAVNVMIMLQRKSDQEVSEAKAFTYYPQNRDKDLIARKKRKKLPLDSSFHYYGGDGGPGGGAPGPGGGMGGYGPPGYGGPGSGMNGGGGGGGQSNYSVIMPNGDIVGQLNVLPTTVEQVVKEEFSRSHNESPDTTSAEDSSPLASPFDPMLWSGSLNDLEIDAAPSLRPPGRSLVAKVQPAAAKSPVTIPDSSSVKAIPDGGLKDCEGGEKEGSVDLTGGSVQGSRSPLQQEKLAQDGKHAKLPADSMTTQTEPTQIILTVDKQADEVTADSCEVSGSTQTMVPKLEKIRIPSDTDSGREDHSDIVLSPTRLSEAGVSEGFRTDEGFSEVSEEASVKEEALPKKVIMQETVIPSEEKSTRKKEADPKEKSNLPLKTATTVVKRVMERITARTIRALQDFSETGDVRYLLLVQRHLTAIKNENGDLPIHLAVINNQTESLHHLLDVMASLPNAGQTVNTYNYVRQTALHLAAIMQQPVHVELLLHAGADPSFADRNGNTPAHLAIINNSLEALRSLIKYLRPGVTATNPFPELDYLNFDGYTPVHLATHSGNVDMLRLLVHGQANVDIPDGKSGRTALHHAVELDDLPVAGFLLMEASADVNARCFDGNTPLHIACCRGLMGMVALLMTAGALTDIENEEIPEDGLEEEVDEGEETSRRCRRGLQPRDYAAGKDRQRILRMLMGDDYLSDGEEGNQSAGDDDDLAEDTEGMMTHKLTYDSGVAVSLTTQSAPGLPMDDKLSEEIRLELSKLLDPVDDGKDVLTLASKLGYNQNFVTALEVMGCSGTSPTHYLLDYHETYGGTVSKLRECLRDMKRDDALRLIQGEEKDLLQRKEHYEHSSVGDSGVLSFSS